MMLMKGLSLLVASTFVSWTLHGCGEVVLDS